MPSKYDDDNENENKNEDDDDETMSQNQKNEIIKEKVIFFKWNHWQIKIIWRANKIVKKREDLKGFWPYNDFGDKELKSKYFKIELADMSNDIDEKLFEQIFGHTLIKLANKLINTTSKEENQVIASNINKNKVKLYGECETTYGCDWVIQPNSWRIDLVDAINLILNFNETIDQVWKYKNQKISKWF